MQVTPSSIDSPEKRLIRPEGSVLSIFLV